MSWNLHRRYNSLGIITRRENTNVALKLGHPQLGPRQSRDGSRHLQILVFLFGLPLACDQLLCFQNKVHFYFFGLTVLLSRYVDTYKCRHTAFLRVNHGSLLIFFFSFFLFLYSFWGSNPGSCACTTVTPLQHPRALPQTSSVIFRLTFSSVPDLFYSNDSHFIQIVIPSFSSVQPCGKGPKRQSGNSLVPTQFSSKTVVRVKF